MLVEFPESKVSFDDIKLAENHLAFEHFPVVMIVNGNKGTFECFTCALQFLKENTK